MNKHLKLKPIFILPIILMILFLFPKNVVNAEERESTEEEMHASNIAKFIIEPIGDLINRGINTISGELTENEAAVTLYTTNEINASYKFRSNINVKNEPDNTQTTSTDGPKEITISNSVYNQYGILEQIYTTDTKIPVLPLDVYTLSAGKAQILDINFWKLEETNTNKIWNYIKNIVRVIAHIVLYLSVALIFTMIIWRSILFVYSTMTSQPEKAEQSKKILDSLFSVILMVVGVYLIMATCTILHDKALQFIFNKNQNQYPIRAVVTGVYSFNTTLIGLIRYKTLTNNIWNELGWSVGYLIISFLDFVYFLLMLARMLILGVLSIAAPITAVMKMSGQSEGKGILQLLQFNNWLKLYLRFTYIPLVIAIVSSFMIGLIS